MYIAIDNAWEDISAVNSLKTKNTQGLYWRVILAEVSQNGRNEELCDVSGEVMYLWAFSVR